MSDKPIRGEWPAFPIHIAGVDEYKGMSLRDWFAGQAMDVVITTYDIAGRIDGYNVNITFDNIAKDSYALADAMLKAREQ